MQLESISTSPAPTAGFRTLVGQVPLASLMVERMSYREKALSTKLCADLGSDAGNLVT